MNFFPLCFNRANEKNLFSSYFEKNEIGIRSKNFKIVTFSIVNERVKVIFVKTRIKKLLNWKASSLAQIPT